MIWLTAVDPLPPVVKDRFEATKIANFREDQWSLHCHRSPLP
jgi:hypothetical protein